MQAVISRILCVSLIYYSTSASAQSLAKFHPSHDEMVQRYHRAAHIDSLTHNAVFKTTVQPHWQSDGHSFWYSNVLKDSAREYFQVNGKSGNKQRLFDNQRLIQSLSAAGVKINPAKLIITEIRMQSGNESAMLLKIDDQWLSFDRSNYSISKIEVQPASAVRQPGVRHWSRYRDFETPNKSPDNHWVVSFDKGNIIIKSLIDSSSFAYTTDGSDSLPYGNVAWSPDSKYLVGYHINPVVDSPVYYILTSLPGTMRGQLRSHEYKQPGDPFTKYTMYLFHPGEPRKTQRVNTDTIDFFGAPELHWHSKNKSMFTYERVDRGHQRFRVIEVNASTGETRNIVDEKTKTFIYESRLMTWYPEGTDLLVHTSEKDGWQHLYITDLITGSEKLVTKGDWVVRSVDSIDVKRKEIWFRASGINRGEDPYNVHVYRTGFDGDRLIALTPDFGNHSIDYSPDRSCFTDTWSQVNIAPVTVLRRTDNGSIISALEHADTSLYLRAGVHPPEVFVAKARDGITDIWGIVSRPSDFDPTKQYPVLENIYAGPQDAFVPKSFTPYSEMQSLAELGFIVVMIDGMGTANRSKAFHDVCWKNIADAGLPDRILWIKALAKKYPYVDIDRVGLYGTSAGGQNTLTALLTHPEFYKAGVAACGCHDNRVDKQWWNEQWMGYPIGKEYAEQSNVTMAGKLQGNLLLIVGEADTNVPPESTYRVIDALIKAGKLFDFLPVPGMNHSDGGPYGRIRKRDFFVRHLLEVDPPDINAGELQASRDTGRERWEFVYNN